jgi:2-oxoisovalerate dehydrogenase E2 component (dihydrolipoyl transacylase)
MLAVETAKAIVEVPSPYAGVIKATHGKPGDTVATGALLVEFEDLPPANTPGPRTTKSPAAALNATMSGATASVSRVAAPAAPASDSGTVVGSMPISDEDFVEAHSSNISGEPGANTHAATPDRVRAVPAARALAKRLGLDITEIRGTGRGELVTVDDVLRMTAVANAARHTPGEHSTNATTPREPGAPAHSLPLPPEGERLRGPRRAMAQSMALARDTVVGCTLFDDADLHYWQAEQDITSRILRAIAAGCAAEPGLNAWFDGEALIRRMLSHIDVAIAVDTPDGLIVPVVRNIGGRPVAQLRADVDRLKRNTHERTVRPEDLRDFTFMLSNFGMIAGRYATPVVVPPSVAILGCGRLSRDVIAIQSGNIEAHLRMPLSLTFDHRCVTGGEAARFLAAVIQDLQKGN